MTQHDLYEQALRTMAPGNAPPSTAIDKDIRLSHYRNAPGDCASPLNEETEDWQCAARQIQDRYLDALHATP